MQLQSLANIQTDSPAPVDLNMPVAPTNPPLFLDAAAAGRPRMLML
jgi:hypothetical protein